MTTFNSFFFFLANNHFQPYFMVLSFIPEMVLSELKSYQELRFPSRIFRIPTAFPQQSTANPPPFYLPFLLIPLKPFPRLYFSAQTPVDKRKIKKFVYSVGKSVILCLLSKN